MNRELFEATVRRIKDQLASVGRLDRPVFWNVEAGSGGFRQNPTGQGAA